jgi:hypothetical protein
MNNSMRKLSFFQIFSIGFFVLGCVFAPQTLFAISAPSNSSVPQGTNSATVAPNNNAPAPSLSGEEETEIETDCKEDTERSGIASVACNVFESPEDRDTCEQDIIAECIRAKEAAVVEARVAQTNRNPYTPTNFSSLNKLGVTNITVGISRMVKALVSVIGSIALAMFVYGGFLWMTSRGNSEQTGKAVKIMVWSALGVIVILSSYSIVDFLFGTFA